MAQAGVAFGAAMRISSRAYLGASLLLMNIISYISQNTSHVVPDSAMTRARPRDGGAESQRTPLGIWTHSPVRTPNHKPSTASTMSEAAPEVAPEAAAQGSSPAEPSKNALKKAQKEKEKATAAPSGLTNTR
jgi:hypothetical protein